MEELAASNARSQTSEGEPYTADRKDNRGQNTDVPFKLNRKIFVGNISYRIGTRKLSGFFKKFGSVDYCYIVKDHIKKWSKGIAFITFSSEEGYRKSLQASDEELYFDQRQMRVKPAEISNRQTFWEERHNKSDDEAEGEATPASMEVESSDSKQALEQTATGSISKDGYISETSMDMLMDEILIRILGLLSLTERISAERVCWRWKHLVHKTWLSKRSLHFRNIFRGFKGLTDKVLNSVVRRCGANLVSLDLTASSRLLTDFSMDIIGKHCPKLQEILLSAMKITDISLGKLATGCPQLQKVSLVSCHYITDHGLKDLLRNCQHLLQLVIDDNSIITGQCFQHAVEGLQKVTLSTCMKMTDEGIEYLTKRCGGLEVIQLARCPSLGKTTLQQICQNCPNLKILHFTGTVVAVSSSAFEKIQNLENLEELNVSFNSSVCDSVLSSLASKCKKLQTIDVSGCHQGISDTGIRELCKLPCLQSINISYLNNVTEVSIQSLANQGQLRKVIARATSFMTDSVVESLALFCTDLEHLDLSSCFQITNSIFESFRGYEERQKTVDLYVGGTCVDWVSNDFNWLSGLPHVHVFMQNLAIDYLRPDHGIILPGDDFEEFADEISFDPHPNIEDFQRARLENYEFDHEFSDEQDEFLDCDDPLAEERWNMS